MYIETDVVYICFTKATLTGVHTSRALVCMDDYCGSILKKGDCDLEIRSVGKEAS